MRTLLITGGAGFIGSNLVHHALSHTSDRIVIVDKLTYAGSLLNLEAPLKDPRVTFLEADIADRRAMTRAFAEHHPDAVLNLAAETHVDRSIDGPQIWKYPRVTFLEAAIADRRAMTRAFAEHHPDAVLNLAAETHVDRSIDGP